MPSHTGREHIPTHKEKGLFFFRCYTRQEARKWEKFYKSGIGREKIKNLMTGSGAAGPGPTGPKAQGLARTPVCRQAGMGCVRSRVQIPPPRLGY